MYVTSKLSVFSFLILLIPIFASAQNQNSCYTNSDFRDESDIAQFIHKTMDYYEGSPRELVDKMTPQNQDRFAATGTLRCGNMIGSAQVTLKNNLLTTAAHFFNDRATCKSKAKPTDCKFSVSSHGKTQTIPVAELVGIGFKCPPLAGRPLPNKVYRDWAVLRLQFPADGITPYQIDDRKVANMKRDDPVITIGHSADFHATKIDGKWILPKHYGTCKIGNVDATFEPYFVSTACGCAEGCSGGSLLTNEANPSLLGVEVQNNESKEELESAMRSGHPNIRHFDYKTYSTDYVPFTGELLDTIRQASLQTSI